MPNFKGIPMTDVNLVGTWREGASTKDGERHFIDFQVDARQPGFENQQHLHLRTKEETYTDKQSGEQRKGYNNDVAYTSEQLNQFIAAAGDNFHHDEARKQTVFGVKASVMPREIKPKEGQTYGDNYLAINTRKPISGSDYQIDENTLTNQFESVKAAKAAAKETPVAEQSAEAPAKAAPSFGAKAAPEGDAPQFGQ